MSGSRGLQGHRSGPLPGWAIQQLPCFSHHCFSHPLGFPQVAKASLRLYKLVFLSEPKQAQKETTQFTGVHICLCLFLRVPILELFFFGGFSPLRQNRSGAPLGARSVGQAELHLGPFAPLAAGRYSCGGGDAAAHRNPSGPPGGGPLPSVSTLGNPSGHWICQLFLFPICVSISQATSLPVLDNWLVSQGFQVPLL